MGLALFAAALGDPGKEAAHARAFGPHEAKEFAGVQASGGRAKERLHAPAQIGAIPGLEAVALGDEPVIAERVQHIGRREAGASDRSFLACMDEILANPRRIVLPLRQPIWKV